MLSPSLPRHAPVSALPSGPGTIPLPRWPITVMFGFFLVWWALGIGDLIWGAMTIPMAAYLAGAKQKVHVPKAFGLWLLFMVWVCASFIELNTAGRMIGFLFRLTIFIGATGAFIYVYNADRKSISIDYIAGIMTVFWMSIVACGFLALALPHGQITTLVALIMPKGLASNGLVTQLVRPRFTQGNVEGYFQLALRPSAPFAYANGWGTNYSLTLPFVLITLTRMKRDIRFWILAALIPLSLIPAFYTQNRGMLLAISIAVVYVAARQLRRGQVAGLAQIALLVTAAGLMLLVVPVNQLIEARLAESGTNTTRLAVYTEAIARTLDSPFFGYGAPRPSTVSAYAPSVGTQGQFWFVLFSFGFVGAGLWMAWFISLSVKTVRAPDTALLWLHTILVMMTIECMFYGMMHAALIVTMITGALAMRESAYYRQQTTIPVISRPKVLSAQREHVS